MPDIGDSGVSFTRVAREWRCKYAMGASGGPGDSACLKACQALLAEHLEALKSLPNAEITRIVCGGCSDFKLIINQPIQDHDEWKAAGYAPEKEFLAALEAIEGTSRVEAQEFTCETM